MYVLLKKKNLFWEKWGNRKRSMTELKRIIKTRQSTKADGKQHHSLLKLSREEKDDMQGKIREKRT